MLQQTKKTRLKNDKVQTKKMRPCSLGELVTLEFDTIIVFNERFRKDIVLTKNPR